MTPWRGPRSLTLHGLGSPRHLASSCMPEVKTPQCIASSGDWQSESIKMRMAILSIGIDPGRRDMIVDVEHLSGQTLKYSTKQAVYESGRRKAQLTTLHAFKGVLHERELLSKYLQRNPSKDSIPSRWRAYLAHVLPCLDVWMSA